MPCRFWIVTPSYRSLRWLPCAVASVADQACSEVEVHHHVQDGGSDDGTREWLAEYAAESARNPRQGYTFSYESAPDGGMYDAINKGWAAAPEAYEFLAHLNSDEQYLPGALAAVAAVDHTKPESDLILGDTLVIDAQGRYICQQSSVIPKGWMARFFCIVLTCGAFYRRRFLLERKGQFDISWRILGDLVFYLHLFKQKTRVALCNRTTSIFVDSGANLALSAGVVNERVRFRNEYVGRLFPLTKLVKKLNLLRRLWKDVNYGLARSYEIYEPCSPERLSRRKHYEITRPTSLWRRKPTAS